MIYFCYRTEEELQPDRRDSNDTVGEFGSGE
jgi:hypothetical protein